MNSGNRPEDGHTIRDVLPKAICVTLLALLLSLLLASPFSATVSGMFSTPERGDFRMTDLYAQIADGRPVRQFDDRIVLIDIGLADRQTIAEGLTVLSLCAPVAVGLDINFAFPGDCDSLLTEAIAANPGIVLPIAMRQTSSGRFEIAEKPFFYGSLNGVGYGVVNLPAEKEGASIREFVTGYTPEKGGVAIPSFANALSMKADSAAAAELAGRGNRLEIIDYASREFKTIPLSEIEDRADELTGKFVIMGSMNEAGDMHATPVNSYVSGMEIHAYSLSTILDRRWLSQMPKWIDYTAATLLCLTMILTALMLTGKTRGLTLRMLQVLFLFAIVWTGYSLFIDKGLICDFSHTIIMLAFGLFALDVWNGLEGIGQHCVNLFKSIKHKKCEPRY